MPGFEVRRWSEAEFLSARDEWQHLLSRSRADGLFMSWDWQTCWWSHHARLLDATLCVLAVYSPAGTLCGLAPFYSHRVRLGKGLTATRLELIGSAWREPAAIFSEYLDLIVPPECEKDVLECVAAWLRPREDWDDVVFAYVREDSLVARLAELHLRRLSYLRRPASVAAWCTRLPNSFEEFTARLSSTTRRKLLNQRKKADVTFEQVPAERIEASVRTLEDFVGQRWGPESTGIRAAFHVAIARIFHVYGGLRLTELHVAGNCISVMLNFRAAQIEYYVMSGFDTRNTAGLSPGYLHFGYAIEAACRDGVRNFDLLGGHGLHRDYKRDFLSESIPLTCYQMVRPRRLQALYLGYDWAKGLGTQLRGMAAGNSRTGSQ